MDKDRVESLNHFLAAEVMGWKEVAALWIIPDSIEALPSQAWNPYENDAQAAMVRRRMVELGYRWSIEYGAVDEDGIAKEEYWCAFYLEGWLDDEGIGTATAPTESAATCEAAAKALGWEGAER